MKIPIFEYSVIQPLKFLGFTSSFWDVHLDTLIYTWCAMGLLILLTIAGRYYLLKKPTSTIESEFYETIRMY